MMDISRIKDSRQYKNLETGKKKIKNRVFEIYYDSVVSICKKKEQNILELGSKIILLYLIECRNKEYKIGYKSNVAEEFRTEIQFVPVQTSLDDYIDASCIKDILHRKEEQLQIVFKDIKKKKWIFTFKEQKLCKYWVELLTSKIIEIDKRQSDRLAARHLESIHLPSRPQTKQVQCQTERMPNDINVKQLSDISSSYKESTINPFHFCMKKASQGKYHIDSQDLRLLKTELRRIYSLELSEQRYVKYFMGVCADMLKTVMALKRQVVLSNQRIVALQQTNSILAQQCCQNQIKIQVNQPRGYVIEQIRQNLSQKRESMTELDSVVTLLQSKYFGPEKEIQNGGQSQRFSLSNLQINNRVQSVVYKQSQIKAAQTSKFFKNKNKS